MARIKPCIAPLCKSVQVAEDWSSKTRYSALFRLIISLLMTAGLVCIACLFPAQALHLTLALSQFFILLMAGLRLLAVALLFIPQPSQTPFLSSTQWPRFTVLAALHKEASMVKSLMENLVRLDYPQDRLQIIMVCEADDTATCAAVKARLRPPFTIFEVPPSEPRTKPKALNAAIAALSSEDIGDIITVYDAEDRPHPRQLKAAAAALQNSSIAAVQAPLGYCNHQQNLLTRFFALEYAALFHVWNPALARLGLPFTLGGTSNHIRRTALEAAGGWDSHNVTEDADLSFRISALSRAPKHMMRIGCIGFGTEEQAASTHTDWTHQRSRWLKGFMQTFSVHTRPKHAAPDGGSLHLAARTKSAFALHITVTATLLAAFLHVPSLIFIAIIAALNSKGLTHIKPPPSFFIILGIGYGSAMLMAMTGAWKVKKYHLLPYAALMPFYWLLYFQAALIAGWEFIFAPDHWRKTPHTPPRKPGSP